MSSVTRASIGVSKGQPIAYESPDQGEAVLRSATRDELRRRMLAAGDGVAAATASATLIFAASGGIEVAFWTLATVPLWILLAHVYGLYGRDETILRHLTVDEIPALFGWALASTGATLLVLLVTPVGSLHALSAVQLCLVAMAAAFLLRAFVRFLWRRLTPPERAFVIGEGQLVEAFRRKLELFPDMHVQITRRAAVVDGLAGRPHQLVDIDRLVLASGEASPNALQDLLALCREHEIKLSTVLPPVRGFGAGAHLHHVADLPVMTYDAGELTRTGSVVKRGLDLALAALGLVLLSPLLLAIALALCLGDRGPVLFVQDRVGLGGRHFRMLKFRTMACDASSPSGAAPLVVQSETPLVKVAADDPRITRVGRFLRRTSLDELPQLWNVIRGDMSLVGPRPELVELVGRWPPEHRIRLSVKPGMTGPMQVYGRSDLTFDEWLAVEREYIENQSIWRDLRILALTLPVAITGRGAF